MAMSARARPFQRFFRTEAAGGLLLLLSAGAALVAANSAWADGYRRLWSMPITVGVGDHPMVLTLHQWINDGLMALFFLLVGLEIKRELVAGELSSRRQAALPIAGAIGGIVLPALIYLLMNRSGLEARGWAIPMATDIAFALGTLNLIAPAIPVGAKLFLTALAIVDDMAAVVVIALFYTQAIDWTSLLLAAVVLAVLIALNVGRVGRLAPYLLCGAALWLFIQRSGIHSTIAGVLLALTIPTRTRINAVDFETEAHALLAEFERTETGDFAVLTSKGQQEAIFALGSASTAVTSPLLRLEHALHGFSAFFVMPLFAFANAGVRFSGSPLDLNVMLGVALGLIFGKSLGITTVALGAVATGLASRPRGVTNVTLYGCAWVGGIGFTMSLFIANLAFEGTPLLDSARVGILGSSLVCGLVAALVFRIGNTATGPSE